MSVEIEPWPEGGYVARAPALQGCWVVSPTIEHAIKDIQEGIEMSIASRAKRGEPLPEDVEVVEQGGGTIQMRLPVMVP